jgi:hypothetical protein
VRGRGIGAVSGVFGGVLGRFRAVQLASGSALAACFISSNERSAFLRTQSVSLFLVHSGF